MDHLKVSRGTESLESSHHKFLSAYKLLRKQGIMEVLEILSESPENALPESVIFQALEDRGMYPNIFYRIEKSMQNYGLITRQKNLESKIQLRITQKGDQFYQILKQMDELCADRKEIPDPPK
jgi:predicted transcriptional regulator